MFIKVLCRGTINGKKTSWASWADEVVRRLDGSLAIFSTVGSNMGFKPGAWEFVRKCGDYDVYTVDFSGRFRPRRRSV